MKRIEFNDIECGETYMWTYAGKLEGDSLSGSSYIFKVLSKDEYNFQIVILMNNYKGYGPYLPGDQCTIGKGYMFFVSENGKLIKL